MMTSFLLALAIGFTLYFGIAWLPQFVRCWIAKGKYKRAKKNASEEDEWIYKI